MSVSKIVTSAVMALSLVAVPTLASAAPAASKLSITAPTSAVSARAGAQTVKGKKAASGLLIGGLAAVAVIVGIIIASNGSKSVSR
jgi:hypothetical protein